MTPPRKCPIAGSLLPPGSFGPGVRIRWSEPLCLAAMLVLLCGVGACRSAGEERSETWNDTGPGRALSSEGTEVDAGSASLNAGAMEGGARSTGSACPDDEREDDDTLEQALAAGLVYHVFGKPLHIQGSVACPGDEDWIHAHGDCCRQAGAIVRWDASVGPLDVELFDEEGKPLPLNQPGDIVQRQPGEVRLLRAKHGGTFLIRIRTSGTVAVPYSVDVVAPVFVR